MIQKQKTMKQIFIFILTLVSLSSFAQVGTKNSIEQNYIEVTGEAEMEIDPDEIYIQIIINEKEYKGNKSLEEIEKEMIRKLEELDIDVSEDLLIKDMVSNFRKYWIVGSAINFMKEYQLIVDKANTAGLVFRELESVGISNISIEKIEHSEIEKYRREVKVKAIKEAREKAVSLTEAIDQETGKAIFIQEMNRPVYRTMEKKAAGLSNIVVKGYGTTEQTAPEIEFEKIKLEYSIMVRFELK